jgi:hypothetical protein
MIHARKIVTVAASEHSFQISLDNETIAVVPAHSHPRDPPLQGLRNQNEQYKMTEQCDDSHAMGVLTARHAPRVRDSAVASGAVVVEQSGLYAGNVRGQPFAMAERHEHVLPAVDEQDRDSDAGKVESPRIDRAVVVPPSLAPGARPSCAEEVRYSASFPCRTAASVGVRSDSIALAESFGDVARSSSRPSSVLPWPQSCL